MYTVHAPLVLLKYHELLLLLGAYLQHTGHVLAPVAVVRSRPDSHDILFLKQLIVTLLNQLMSTSYQCQPVVMVELIDHLWAEKPADPSMILRPSLDIFRIRPHQVPKWAFRWNFLHSVDFSNLIDGMNVGRKPSVYTKNMI